MQGTIVPNTAGLRLLRVWRLEDGTIAPERLPVVAFEVMEGGHRLAVIVPGGREEIEDRMRDPRENCSAWATALVDTAGEVFDADGQIFSSCDSYVKALRLRDEEMIQKPPREKPAAP